MSEHKAHKHEVKQEMGYKTTPSKAKCVRCGGTPMSKQQRAMVRKQREQEAIKRLAQAQKKDDTQHQARHIV